MTFHDEKPFTLTDAEKRAIKGNHTAKPVLVHQRPEDFGVGSEILASMRQAQSDALRKVIAETGPEWVKAYAGTDTTQIAAETVLANCNPDFKIQFANADEGAPQAMTPEQDFALATRLAVRRMLGCTSEEAINLVGDPSEYFADGTFTPEQAAAEIIAEAATDSL
ncbi:MAG: hypothetical protein H7Y60_16905 [Rhodospirillaceae bacterium]|nr:hypothetical protein [Rhodospirillales bacterium]